ncbi:hypothetical protein HNQ35_001290 [Cerasibacillus quisquiliarum]|uniref:Uncharacterized protein n=1 Tax=Cerasibacillus quisquiliarum TaxID=227865 RepID=A0A511V0G8_9BACI|nr:hypothetical protein [Cerasibacillus quisquiliarum]GEN30822.1 hypothetical protein CQU01_10600 [Cerasibacillus quisquiliarum]
MEKFLIIVIVLSLGSAMVLFTGHFIKHGLSKSLHLSNFLKGALASFLIYLITFISYIYFMN